MRPANKRRHYTVASFFIGCAHRKKSLLNTWTRAFLQCNTFRVIHWACTFSVHPKKHVHSSVCLVVLCCDNVLVDFTIHFRVASLVQLHLYQWSNPPLCQKKCHLRKRNTKVIKSTSHHACWLLLLYQHRRLSWCKLCPTWWHRGVGLGLGVGGVGVGLGLGGCGGWGCVGVGGGGVGGLGVGGWGGVCHYGDPKHYHRWQSCHDDL